MAQSTVSLGTTEAWSIFEKLCLTSILKKTGCGDWNVVSDLMNILNAGDNEKFTSQNCAMEFEGLSDAANVQREKGNEDMEHQLIDEIHQKVVADRIIELEKLAEEDRRVLRQMRKKYESFLSTADVNTIEAEYNLISDTQEQECGSESDSDAFDTRQSPRRRTRARSSAISSNTSQDEADKEESPPATPLSASRDSESAASGAAPDSPAASGSAQKKIRQQQPSTQAPKSGVTPRRQQAQPRPPSASDTDSFSETASPAPTPSSSPEKDRDYYRWKRAILMLWRTISNHRNANLFMHPVREDIAPGYSLAIKRPMTLMMVKKAIESGAIRTTEEFMRDLLLMFQNAVMYNNSDTEVYHMATDMRAFAVTHIKEFLSTLEPPEQNILREKGDGAEKEEERRSLRRSTAEAVDTSTKPKRRT